MTTSPSLFTRASDTLLAPARAFDTHLRDPRYGALLAVLTLATLAFHALFFLRLDYAWFAEHLRATLPAALRRELPADFAVTRASVFLPAVVSAALKPTVLVTALAGWLAVVGRVRGTGPGFVQCMAIAAWSALPWLLVLPLELVETLRQGSGQVALEDVDPTTLNALVWHLEVGDRGYGLATGVSLATLWSAVLCAIGVRRAMGTGWAGSAAIVAPAWLAALAPAIVLAAA